MPRHVTINDIAIQGLHIIWDGLHARQVVVEYALVGAGNEQFGARTFTLDLSATQRNTLTHFVNTHLLPPIMTEEKI